MNRFTWLLVALGGIIVARELRAAGLLELGDPEDQTGDILDQAPALEDLGNLVTDTFNPPDMDTAQRNLAAVLYAIRKAEGTAASDEGYRALFGWRPGNGKTFEDMSDHPRIFTNYTDLAGKTIRTSAAGAYQITATTFDNLMRKYPGRFSGFTPLDQDAMATALIDEKGAMRDVAAGRLGAALAKLRGTWASLPGAGSNQPERSLAYLEQAYISAGGTLA